jgi:hypothetical protein
MTLLAANELNLDAIDLIQTCLEREAIQLFDATWGTLNFHQPAQLLDDAPIVGGINAMPPPNFTLESVSTDDFMSASIYQNNEWSVAAEPCYSFFTIFNRAFKFHPIEGDLEQMPRTSWFEFATNMPIAVFFNHGLAYHIWALREDSTALFSVALQHYNQAFRLILDQSRMLQYKSEMDILYMGLNGCIGAMNSCTS